jgi:hypothetical protein
MDFLIALIIGGIVGALILWMRNRGIAVKWYEWLIGAAGLLALWFAVSNYFGSLEEFQPSAATTFLWLVGIPALVLICVAVFLAWRHNKASA